MSEEKSPQKSTPSDKVVCPLASLNADSQVLRRQDLADLGGTFKDALRPLKEILDHMRGLNARYAASNRQLRRVTRFQVAISLVSASILLVLVVTVGYMWRALDMLESHTTTLGQLEEDVKAQTSELTKVKQTTQQTEERVAKAEEKQDSAPTLELIPETDPVKARRAPVRLRVKAPAVQAQPVPSTSAGVSSGSSVVVSPPPVAEIPIAAEPL